MVRTNRFITSIVSLVMTMSLVFAPICQVNAATASTDGSMKVSATEPEAGAVVEETYPEVKPELEAMSRDELIDFTESIIKENADGDANGNYKFTVEDDKVVIDLWYTGVNAIIKIAANDTTYKATWDYIIEEMRQLCGTMAGPYKEYGMDVYINILNDENTEEQLFSCKNGIVEYDILATE